MTAESAPYRPFLLLVSAGALLLPGCQSPSSYRRSADRAAAEIISRQQENALGRQEPFTVEKPSDTLRKRLLTGQDLSMTGPVSLGTSYLEPIEHWPEKDRPGDGSRSETSAAPWAEGGPLRLTLLEALGISARNNREYQTQKEEVFRSALNLDLERQEFRNSFAGLLEGIIGTSGREGSSVTQTGMSAESSLTRRLQSGVELTGLIALDLVKLLTQDRSSSLGILADATVSIPLLRGAGRYIAAEPLTQAERDVLYAIWSFERFKKQFAVRVASDYLGVLLAHKEVDNAEQNYIGLITSTRRARRQAESGRLPWFQFDQSLQNELRARDRWIRTRESHDRRLDAFKVQMGLPTDASIELDTAEIDKLAAKVSRVAALMEPEAGSGSVPPADAPVVLKEPERKGAGLPEMEDREALDLALESRLDLRIALGRVYDAQRGVVTAADDLRGELTLLGSAAVGERRGAGSADQPDAKIALDEGRYAALLGLDLPLERTAERNAYRESYISLERSVRDAQELEDRVKLEVRNRLRDMLESREGILIQLQAVTIAERRVKSTDLFLQAGRAQIRDLLESSEALLNARNALASALVDYRVSELELQRDLGVLAVDEKGMWKEFNPGETDDGNS